MANASGGDHIDLGQDGDGYDDNDDDDDALPDHAERSTLSDSPTPPPEQWKRSRYLRESDRHAILQRIDNGERQADLAREFGVTRAAVCHINRNRDEILRRSSRPDVHAAARHPKRRMSGTEIIERQRQRRQRVPSGSSWAVFEVPSTALALRMATLRDEATASQTFRTTADRAMRLLMEEALASASPQAFSSTDVSSQRASCALVLGESGHPMLTAFQAIEPDSPTGFMTLDVGDHASPISNGHLSSSPRLALRKMCAPLDLRHRNVFLLDATCEAAAPICVAIQSLLDFDVAESQIFVTALVVRSAVVAEIGQRFPRARIVVAAVDADLDTTGCASIGNFVERYFNTMVVHKSDRGSVVNL